MSRNKINRPTNQIPNPQNPGSPTCQEKTKQGERKQPQDWATYLAKPEKSPQLLKKYTKI